MKRLGIKILNIVCSKIGIIIVCLIIAGAIIAMFTNIYVASTNKVKAENEENRTKVVHFLGNVEKMEPFVDT